MRRTLAAQLAAAVILASALPASAEVGREQVQALLAARAAADAYRALGPEVMPVLAELYRESNPEQRREIAGAFYQIGWKSEEARRALEPDLTSADQGLRLTVQWAIGRVSDDEEVVEHLLWILRNDSSALFSEKAACALAHDQIHLTERQKLRLYRGLVETLYSEKPRVRRDALRALQIHTGQTRGFEAGGPPDRRLAAIRSWERWLEEYEANL